MMNDLKQIFQIERGMINAESNNRSRTSAKIEPPTSITSGCRMMAMINFTRSMQNQIIDKEQQQKLNLKLQSLVAVELW